MFYYGDLNLAEYFNDWNPGTLFGGFRTGEIFEKQVDPNNGFNDDIM